MIAVGGYVAIAVLLLLWLQVFSNYATVLRRNGQLDEALRWYECSLAGNPDDFTSVANLGFTLHLLRRWVHHILTC